MYQSILLEVFFFFFIPLNVAWNYQHEHPHTVQRRSKCDASIRLSVPSSRDAHTHTKAHRHAQSESESAASQRKEVTGSLLQHEIFESTSSDTQRHPHTFSTHAELLACQSWFDTSDSTEVVTRSTGEKQFKKRRRKKYSIPSVSSGSCAEVSRQQALDRLLQLLNWVALRSSLVCVKVSISRMLASKQGHESCIQHPQQQVVWMILWLIWIVKCGLMKAIAESHPRETPTASIWFLLEPERFCVDCSAKVVHCFWICLPY